MTRDHRITLAFRDRPDGGMDMVCGSCGRPVGVTAFEYGPMDEAYTRRIKDFYRHYSERRAA